MGRTSVNLSLTLALSLSTITSAVMSNLLTCLQPAAAKAGDPIGAVESPGDLNLFQIEPSMLDERHYTSGRAERHQNVGNTLPFGAPIPDSDPPLSSGSNSDKKSGAGSTSGGVSGNSTTSTGAGVSLGAASSSPAAASSSNSNVPKQGSSDWPASATANSGKSAEASSQTKLDPAPAKTPSPGFDGKDRSHYSGLRIPLPILPAGSPIPDSN